MLAHTPTAQIRGTLSLFNIKPINILILIDNGATSSFISSRTVKQFNLPIKPCNNTIGAATANNAVIPIEYTCTIDILIDSYTETLTLFVLNDILRYDVILGNNWLINKHAIQDYVKHTIDIDHNDKRIRLCSKVNSQLISCHEIATLLNIQCQHHSRRLISSTKPSVRIHRQRRKLCKSQLKNDIPNYEFYVVLFTADTSVEIQPINDTPYSKQLYSDVVSQYSDVILM